MGVVSNPLPGASISAASGLSLADGFKVVTFNFSASYTTGGEAIVVPGFTTIDAVFIQASAQPAAAAGSYIWNPTTSKLQAFVSTTGAEVAATTNLSTYTLTLLVFGR